VMVMLNNKPFLLLSYHLAAEGALLKHQDSSEESSSSSSHPKKPSTITEALRVILLDR